MYTPPPLQTVTNTVEIPIPQPPVYITQKARIRFVRDTVVMRDSATGMDTLIVRDTLYTTPPFVASLDTVTAKGDTIGVAFRYPSAMFDVAIREAPDTMKIQTVTIRIPEQRSVWVDIGTHAAAFIAGFFAGGTR